MGRARGSKLQTFFARIRELLEEPGADWRWTWRREDDRPWYARAEFISPGTPWALLIESFTRMEDDPLLDHYAGDYSAQWAVDVQPANTRRVGDRKFFFLSAADSFGVATNQALGKILEFAEHYRSALIVRVLLYLGDVPEWVPRKQWDELAPSEQEAIYAKRRGLLGMGLKKRPRLKKKPKRTRKAASSSSTSRRTSGRTSSPPASSRKKATTKKSPTRKRASTPSGGKAKPKVRPSTRGTAATTTSSGRSRSAGPAASRPASGSRRPASPPSGGSKGRASRTPAPSSRSRSSKPRR